MFAFSKQIRDNVLVLGFQPNFSLDHDTIEEVQHEISYWIAEHPRLAIDLTNLAYANAQGLGVLLSLFKRLDRDGGAVAFFGVSRRVGQALGATRADRLLPLFDDADEALAWLADQNSDAARAGAEVDVERDEPGPDDAD
ncbi:MAG: STAS domain-containing protein [Planctomycetes bacterium]|nr:STAS domain-containing protein [Planctomycetota bacterium]